MKIKKLFKTLLILLVVFILTGCRNKKDVDLSGFNTETQKAIDNSDTYYLLQGRDENGLRSLRESNLTIRFGQTDEKLFANEDNDTLFNYLKENKLSIKQYFDTFSIKTNSSDSAIGIAHGHLDSYDGYHSK